MCVYTEQETFEDLYRFSMSNDKNLKKEAGRLEREPRFCALGLCRETGDDGEP